MKKIKVFFSKLTMALIVMPLTFGMAFATAADNDAFADMVGPIEKIMNVISGPIAQMVGVICIVIAGLGIAFGEGGSGVRRLFQVVMGLAIAFTAASLISKLFGASSGLVF